MQWPTPPLTSREEPEPVIKSKIGVMQRRKVQLWVKRSSLQAIFGFISDIEENCEFKIDKVELGDGVVLSLPQHIEQIKNLLLGVADIEPLGMRTYQEKMRFGTDGVPLANTDELKWRIIVKMGKYNMGLNGERLGLPIVTYTCHGCIVM